MPIKSLAPPANPSIIPPRGTHTAFFVVFGGSGSVYGHDVRSGHPGTLTTWGANSAVPGRTTSPWGSVPLFSHTGGTASITFPKSYINPYGGMFTLYSVGNVTTSGSFEQELIGLGSGGLTSETGIFLSIYGGKLALVIPTIAGVDSGISVTMGDWFAAAATYDPDASTRRFWLWNYVTDTMSTASISNSSTINTFCDGVPNVNMNQNETASSIDGSVVASGIDTVTWKDEDFARFVADPFWSVRPPSRAWITPYTSTQIPNDFPAALLPSM